MSDMHTCRVFRNTQPTFIAIRLFKSQKNNAIFCFICLGSLVRFMRNRLEHLQSPSAPTQPTYTHLSHTALCKNSNCTCIHTQENTQPILQCADPTQVTHSHCRAHTHTHGLLVVSPAVEIGQPTWALLSAVLQSQSAKHFLLGLTFLLHHAHKYPLWVLYGPILFFFFSYSVPEVPWTCYPVSSMTVGEQSIIRTPPNIAQHPLGAVDWILRVREKTCIQTNKWNHPHEGHVSEYVALNVSRWSREYYFCPVYNLLSCKSTILGVDHMKDLLGWFVLFPRQLVSERKKNILWSPGW